ncbi:MAG TPA: class II aldolase/adducin family protein [Dehalococcoidia bacterium]|nr:class II aldolase/adducin family protein [Dehalococcoidia bacterium]
MTAILDDFQQVGRLLWEAGLVSSHGGNMSVCLPDGAVLITRHGAMLGRLQDGDLVTVAPDGSVEGDPSIDTPLHQAIYAATDAGAVVHAHPRHAIALSLVRRAIEPQDLEGKHYLGDLVPVVTTDELAASLLRHPIAVTPGHGSYARGESLWQALQWTSVLEESAEVLCLLCGFGG